MTIAIQILRDKINKALDRGRQLSADIDLYKQQIETNESMLNETILEYKELEEAIKLLEDSCK